MSYLVFWNFTKYLRNVFETFLNDYFWLAEPDKIYTSYFQGWKNNRCYVKYVFWKNFKNSIKLLKSPFIVMLQTFFYLSSQWEIGHSHWTPRAFEGDTLRSLQGHSKSTWSLGHLMHSGTWALKALGHPGTWAREHSKGTWTLRHLGTRNTRGTLFTWLEKIPVLVEIKPHPDGLCG